eukprot:gene14027-19965_t
MGAACLLHPAFCVSLAGPLNYLIFTIVHMLLHSFVLTKAYLACAKLGTRKAILLGVGGICMYYLVCAQVAQQLLGIQQLWVRPELDGLREAQLAYINGPFNMMGEILEEIRKQRVDCIVIVPVWPKLWRAILPELPIRETWGMPMRSDLWQPGALIPLGKRSVSVCVSVAVSVS